MPQHNDIILEVEGIKFRERAACAQQRQDLHCLYILHFTFSGNRDLTSGQQRVPGNDGSHNILIIISDIAFIIIGHRTQVVRLDQPVEGYGCPGGTFQLTGFALLVDLKTSIEFIQFVFYIFIGNIVTVGFQFAHLHNFHMRTENRRLPGQVGIHIEHPAIIMAQDSHAVILHPIYHTGGIDPAVYLLPHIFFLQIATYDFIRNTGAVEHAGKFRDGTGLAMCQPFTGHFPPVTQSVYIFIVDCRNRLDIQENNRDLHTLGQRQDRRR